MRWTKLTWQTVEQASDRLTDLVGKRGRLTTHEHNEKELLKLLIRDFDEANSTKEPIEPYQMIQFQMEGHGLSNRDLEPILGDPAVVSRIVNGKRDVPKAKRAALAAFLKLSISELIPHKSQTRVSVES